MIYRVEITEAAKRDIRENTAWWTEHRSLVEARRWYEAIYPAMQSLDQMPERCGFSDNQILAEHGVRELLFGLSGQKIHRIFFRIQSDLVEILRVRACKQDEIGPSELSG